MREKFGLGSLWGASTPQEPVNGRPQVVFPLAPSVPTASLCGFRAPSMSMLSSVKYSHALRRQARWATLLLLASTSCRAPLADSSLTKGLADVFSWNKSLDRKPWSEPRAGTTRGLLSLSLFSDFSADVVSTLGGFEVNRVWRLERFHGGE